MPISPRRQLALAGLLLVLAGIFLGGGQPGAGGLFVPPWDKLAHLLTYAAIAVLCALAFPQWPLPAVLLAVAAIGMADELHQLLLPERQPAIDDWLADLLGAALAWPALKRLRYRIVTQEPQ